MSRLSQRMNAGVGSSRSMNANFAGSDFFEGALQLVLDGVAMLLTLPARERRAVVRDCELKSRWHFVRDPESPAKSFGPQLDRQCFAFVASFFRPHSTRGWPRWSLIARPRFRPDTEVGREVWPRIPAPPVRLSRFRRSCVSEFQ